MLQWRLNVELLNNSIFTGIITGVGTKKEYRKHGISRILFKKCFEYLKERGVKIAHLYSKIDTLDFYYHFGFLNSKKRKEESFYRMFYVIQPFTTNNKIINDTQEFIDIINNEENNKWKFVIHNTNNIN